MKRIRYNRSDINSALQAAKKISTPKSPRYVYATALGFTIGKSPAPFGQTYYKVTPQTIEKIKRVFVFSTCEIVEQNTATTTQVLAADSPRAGSSPAVAA